MNKKIGTLIIAFLMILTVAICGCTDSSSSATETNENTNTITVVDAAGRTVEVPKNPEKIIALRGASREVVYLRAQDKIIGIEFREGSLKGDGIYPSAFQIPHIAAYPELINLTVVTAGSTINFEEITKIQPDIIFMGTSGALYADDTQKKTGIPVVIVHVNAVGTEAEHEKYYETLRLMGEILGKEERAEELISIIEEYETDLANRVADIPDEERPTVYIAGRPYCGAHGLDGTDAQWIPFRLINANNIASGLSNISEGLTINKEQLLEWDPEYIFASEASMRFINNDLSDSAYQGLSAIKNGNVYGVLPYCWYSYNKDSGIADAYFIGKTIYPEQFSDIDPEAKADEIYEKFLGKPVYSAMETQFGGYIELTNN
ncbi:iron ABC transporter substrate-binding protein [Methanococcus maripaludis]|uniref:Iron complex transport system substrate-binding protein n=2 Tax=Methanococcus maripaludis TaxID=39152 RepID=A0A7J9PEI2_METMI|nr:iron ABC transporter substrate-binding protein [Methanococcus maripaludis]MBA2861146.1 iron complex transport system substrate-binding protein [Methanococcus maripaludis]